ncbi:hypothetical protein Moror_4209 [Moniliophthora roreri MCA 2997]|uniref:Uncharacterized protein n=1 Tax=Moniliophthora roreri (strain MCA 2997) TaxID=1381753 RepID=V2XDT9_MONRO|nr:hypothetical protein Moror_4209 [Moniliophthora roreri MCA 2997]
MENASDGGSSSRLKNFEQTIIEEPSNRRPSFNPYSQSSMVAVDNPSSNSKSRRFNPIANAMLRPHRDLPPKRRKVIYPLDDLSLRPRNRAKHKEKPSAAHWLMSDPEDCLTSDSADRLISDCEENTEVDRLDAILSDSEEPKAQKDTNLKAAPSKPPPKLPKPLKKTQPEGPSPRPSPAVLCPDDDVTEDSSRPLTEPAMQRVDDIEKKSLPVIDIPQYRRLALKTRMKSRNIIKIPEDVALISHGPPKPIKPAATSSTPIHNSKTKPKEDSSISSEERICLPVEEWCLGKIYFLEPCTISFEPKGKHVTVRYEDVEEVFYIAHITNTMWSEPETFFCVNLCFNRPMRKQTIGPNYQDHFRPGEAGGKSDITFKFNTSDESWSRDGWNAFVYRLQESGLASRCPLRGDEPAEVVWREACKRTTRNRGRPKPKVFCSTEDIEHQTSPNAKDQRTRTTDAVKAELPSQDTETQRLQEALEQARRETEETNASLRKLQDDNAKAAEEMKLAQTEALKHSQEVQRLQESVKLGQEEVNRLKAEKESLSSSLLEATNRAKHLLRVQTTETANIKELVKQFASVRARFSDGKISREDVESTCNRLGMDLIVIMSRLEDQDHRDCGENEVQHPPKKRKLDDDTSHILRALSSHFFA